MEQRRHEMDRPKLQAWLDRYVAAWRSSERSAIEALFAHDARYWYGPFGEPVEGRTAIADSWLEEPDEPGSWEAVYTVLAIDGDVHVASGESRYRSADDPDVFDRVHSNVFVCRFDGDGRCTEFREWFMERPEQER
jgi:hypothetical protein